MNRDEVMEQLGDMARLRVRDVQHSSRTRVAVAQDGEAMSIRPGFGTPILVPKESTAKLLNFAGIPAQVARRLMPDTLGRAVTECLGAQDQYALVMRDNEMADIVQPGQRRSVNPERLLNTVERAIPDTDYHRVNRLNEYAVNLEIVGVQERPVVRGDLVRAGVSVTFSPIGIVTPQVEAYALRLACTNGMTSTTNFGEYTFSGNGSGNGHEESLWTWLRRSVRLAYGSLGELVERWREMRNERIAPEQRAEVLDALIRQAKLPKQVADEVRARAMADPPRNAWEAMNHITWASSHRLNGEQVMRARQATAQFTDESQHSRLCPVCHHQRQSRRPRQAN